MWSCQTILTLCFCHCNKSPWKSPKLVIMYKLYLGENNVTFILYPSLPFYSFLFMPELYVLNFVMKYFSLCFLYSVSRFFTCCDLECWSGPRLLCPNGCFEHSPGVRLNGTLGIFWFLLCTCSYISPCHIRSYRQCCNCYS